MSLGRWATGQGGWVNTSQWVAGDFNGDGLDDMAKAFESGGGINIDVHISSGSNFSLGRWATEQGGWANSARWVSGDFNGDGLDDMAKAFESGGGINVDVHQSLL